MQRLKYCLYDPQTKILSHEKPPATFEDKCLSTFFLQRFDEHGDKPFHTELLTKKSVTFRQVKEDSLRIASSLISQLNLNVGDVVFGYSPTSSIYATTVYACIFAGLTFTGELPRLSSVSLLPQLQDSKAKAIITSTGCLSRITEALLQCPHVEAVILLDSASDLVVPGVKVVTVAELIATGAVDDPRIPRKVSEEPKDYIVFLPYSSGSTGRAKGVKRSAHSYFSLWYNRFEERVPATVSCFESFGHMSGQFSLVWTLANGNHAIMMPELTIDNLLKAISEFKINIAFIPPTLVAPLSKMQLPADCDTSSLMLVACGGAPLPAGVVEPFLTKFPSVVKLVNSYGLSEGAMATSTPLECDNYQTIGSVTRGCEVKVVNRDTGEACSFNEVGEICMRSDMCASGYLNRPEAQAETFTDDGWVRTGDAGYFDEDGLFFLVDRFKEMIKVHINQVAPAELQALLCLHPQVIEACVVATPDPETGERPRAFVVPRDMNNLPSEEEIVNFVNEQVVEYRQIKGGLFLVESLPKMVIGKVDRQLVKRQPEVLKYLNPAKTPL